MKEKIAITLILLLPAIPAIAVAVDLMGFGKSPANFSGDYAFRGMNPVAALGWGFGVYFIGLSLFGIAAIFILSFQGRRKLRSKRGP